MRRLCERHGIAYGSRVEGPMRDAWAEREAIGEALGQSPSCSSRTAARRIETAWARVGTSCRQTGKVSVMAKFSACDRSPSQRASGTTLSLLPAKSSSAATNRTRSPEARRPGMVAASRWNLMNSAMPLKTSVPATAARSHRLARIVDACIRQAQKATAT